MIKIRNIDGQPSSAPDELQILLLLNLTEGLKDAPESIHDRVIIVISGERSDQLELLCIENFLATSPRLDRIPAEIGHLVDIAMQGNFQPGLN